MSLQQTAKQYEDLEEMEGDGDSDEEDLWKDKEITFSNTGNT